MTSATAQTRFGSGRSVHRVEDEALLKGAGRFTDDVSAPGQLYVHLPALALSARAPRRDRRSGGAVDAGRRVDRHRRGSRARGREAAAQFRRFQACRRHPDRLAAAPRARGRDRALRRRSGRRRRRAKRASRRATPPTRSTCVTSRCRKSSTPPQRSRRAPRWYGRKRPATSRRRRVTAARRRPTRHSPARRTSCRSISFNQRVAPCPIEPRATLALFDAATDRITLHVRCQTPTGLRDDAARRARHPARQGARAGGGRRRRLRHEDGALSRRRRRGVVRPRARAAGQVDAPIASRSSCPPPTVATCAARPSSRSTPTGKCARAARAFARQRGRLRDARRRVIQLIDRPVGGDQHLRHRHHRHPHRGGPHEHDADRPISRRRPSGSDLHDRAPDGCGGAQARASIRSRFVAAT